MWHKRVQWRSFRTHFLPAGFESLLSRPETSSPSPFTSHLRWVPGRSAIRAVGDPRTPQEMTALHGIARLGRSWKAADESWLLAAHGLAAKEAQISSLPFRAKMCRFAYAGGDQATFRPPKGKVGSSTATRLISL